MFDLYWKFNLQEYFIKFYLNKFVLLAVAPLKKISRFGFFSQYWDYNDVMLASWNNFKDLYTLEHGQKKKGGDYFQNLCILEHGQEKGGTIIPKSFILWTMDRKKGGIGWLFSKSLYFGHEQKEKGGIIIRIL